MNFHHSASTGCCDAIHNSKFIIHNYLRCFPLLTSGHGDNPRKQARVSRVFMICPEPIRRLTAGVGTRFVALAEVLSRAGHDVTVAIPNDPAEAEAVQPPVELMQAIPDALGAQAEDHDP